MAKNVDTVAKKGSNVGSLADFVSRIENLQSDIDTIMGDAQDECAPLRDNIKEVKDEAASAGIGKRELNAVISQRRKIAKAIQAPKSLNEDQLAAFNTFIGDLKDTPLGKYAFDMAAAA